MFSKIILFIKNFFKEVSKDLKKINISSIFSNTKLLIILLLIILASIIVFTNLNFWLVFKGIFFGLVLYFIFLWRK